MDELTRDVSALVDTLKEHVANDDRYARKTFTQMWGGGSTPLPEPPADYRADTDRLVIINRHPVEQPWNS